MLEVVELGKAFSGISVLHAVSFRVGAGEAVAVIGPNGAGKSTLLRCLVGAEEADEGTVRLDGEPLDESNPATRSAVAALLDDVDHFPDLSVVEHLRLYAWAHGERNADDVVADVVADLQLGPVQDQLPATLSSGQRHRLGLASCFVRPRRLLVLDEPEARLDTAGREWLQVRLNQEKAAGAAVVFTTHSRELTERVADAVVEFG